MITKNLMDTLAVTVSPRELFHCCKCEKAVSYVEVHQHMSERRVEIKAGCHGEAFELEGDMDKEWELPIRVFDNADKN